jgi:hypothetical protein
LECGGKGGRPKTRLAVLMGKDGVASI